MEPVLSWFLLHGFGMALINLTLFALNLHYFTFQQCNATMAWSTRPVEHPVLRDAPILARKQRLMRARQPAWKDATALATRFFTTVRHNISRYYLYLCITICNMKVVNSGCGVPRHMANLPSATFLSLSVHEKASQNQRQSTVSIPDAFPCTLDRKPKASIRLI